ncbi:Quinate repressor [Fusarium albosuccineum]|uniref:Quinate repressor n=1 Tax=Fusarium albosuccineum TaxID=1237068 RepID=A0A8H4PDI2_9HYPO|nr:Quinate repressor [Fusarium albosuccineum]
MHQYDADASIVLIGMRGTGMSTLAVMASGALGFRLLESDHYFFKSTGLSRAEYKSTHGILQYRSEEVRLMRAMLFDNPTRTVIVCGPGAVEGTGKELLAEYAKTHPIIYIMRDADEIRQHLRVWDVATINDLMRRLGPSYRSVSHYEFFNSSDKSPIGTEANSSSGTQSPKSLALKNVEEDFLHLINGIARQDGYRYKAPHNLSSVPLEKRRFTYALSLPWSTIQALGPTLRGTDLEADAIEPRTSLSDLGIDGSGFDSTIADQISQQVSFVRRHIRLPIIYHIVADNSYPRRPESEATMNQGAYLNLLRHALRLAPDYLCVDLECDDEEIQSLVASKGNTKILANYTEPNPSLRGWDSSTRWDLVRRAQSLGCDIVRICQEATSTADNFSVQHFVHQIKSCETYTIPLIAYNTGTLGRMSCYSNSIFTPVTHTLVRELAPDCPLISFLTVQEAQRALFSSFLLDAQLFGIYGNDVSQSLSPAMHNAAFQLLGMPHRYESFSRTSLADLDPLINDPSFGGASISAPFKADVMSYVDLMSPEAKAIGAVNTLVSLKSASADDLLDRNKAGKTVALFGENTDWLGIYKCILQNLSPINAVRLRTTAVVLGAGGMARAAVYALVRLHVPTIYVHNRTTQKAEELVQQFDGQSFTSHTESRRNSESDSHRNQDLSKSTLRLLESKAESWPSDAHLPTIIISCITTQDINGRSSVDTSVPSSWLASPTGGVAIEV